MAHRKTSSHTGGSVREILNSPFFILHFFLIFFLSGVTSLSAQDTIRPPFEDFIFEAVVNDEEGYTVVALDDQMWLAYDHSDGVLAYAWEGGDTLIRPQDGSLPRLTTKKNFRYISGKPAAPYWQVSQGKENLAVEVTDLRIRKEEGQAVVTYDLALQGGTTLQVEERPVFSREKKYRLPRLTRSFQRLNAEKKLKLTLKVAAEDLMLSKDIKSNAKFRAVEKQKMYFDWGYLFTYSADMEIKPSGSTEIAITYTPFPESIAVDRQPINKPDRP